MSGMELDERGVVSVCGQCGQRNRLAYARLHESFRCGKCQATLSLPGEPIDVPSAVVFTALVRSATLPVLTDFWAPWCGPCKMVAPEVASFAASSAGRIVVTKVNTETVPALAQQFGISGIPTFILFCRSAEVARRSGGMSAAQLGRFVEENAERLGR
jgi:thioredoxin 2